MIPHTLANHFYPRMQMLALEQEAAQRAEQHALKKEAEADELQAK